MALLLFVGLWLAGCGSGGYAGAGIASLSSSTITIDAGQSFQVTASVSGNEQVSWTMAGASCSGSACGTLSTTTGSSLTYTAPTGISAPLTLTLTASLEGTDNSKVVNVTVNPDPTISGTLAPGTVGMAYSQTLVAAGGTSPLTWSIVGSLPAGLSFNSKTGVISGTPTAAGSTSFSAQIIDSSDVPFTVKAAETIVISTAISPLTLSGNPPAGSVGVVYSAQLNASGGTAPYSFSVTAGSLPNGLALQPASGTITGTPTEAGTSSFTAQVQDASGATASANLMIFINTANNTQTLSLSTLPGATVGVPYTGTIVVTGGTAPYTCQQIAGSLPAGLVLSPACIVSGIPTAAGTSTVMVEATDSSSPALSTTGPETITVAPAGSLTLTFPPNGVVGTPYSGSIGVTGGTAPYTCTLVSGSMPAGLTLASNCSITGTPTMAGTTNVTVTATDAGSPAKTITGPVSLTIVASGLTLTLSTLPGATVGVPYTATIGVAGGTAPYSCQQAGGSLPDGLTLSSSCVVSGTPTIEGTSTLQVTATDSSSPAGSVTGPETITVAAAQGTLTITSPPAGTVGTPYSGTIGVSGGTSPYSCTIVSGTLPAGLTLGAGCVITGTPTIPGSTTVAVTATDSSNPVETGTGTIIVSVVAAPPTLTITSPPGATVNVPYTGTIGVAGGNAPYTCTLAGGTLPAGLSLSAGCVVSGTPTTAGSATVTVKATDSSSPVATTTGPVTITVAAATSTLTLSSPANAVVGVPYNGTIGVSGGTAPYSCTLVSGTLPAGLSLGAACAITGTPTTAGTVSVTVHATDSATPTANTVTGPVSITVSPVAPLTLSGSLPNATLGVAYEQTLQAMGGIKPYSYAITAGQLPAGLTLSAAGVISGTPTQVGASSFTVTVTDTESTPQTASLPLVLLVVYPSTPNDAELKGPYAFLFQGYDDVTAGVLAYQTATIASFTADGAGGITAGEMDSNHQSSNPSGNTVSTHGFLGTYTLGTNNQGYMTLTTLNSDGTAGATATYAITAKAPVSPATVASQVDMIEYDDNNLQGTRGSGTMLSQDATAFNAGLKGSYAFGVSGDTPCLPACTVGIVAGPAAAVGQFTTDGISALTSGTSDANIATTNFANEALTGSYAAADANGRLHLTMQTAGTPNGVYPADFAVYLVNSNQAFLMSTDKHSSYILLAGSAQLQTQSSFSNASLNGAIIGYENAQVNPGLVGVTLSDTLNVSTATIFRATGNGSGSCDITNVDVAGLTGLVNQLTGLGALAPNLNALLGTYQSTGSVTCAISGNGRGQLTYPAPSNLLTTTLQLLGLSSNPPAPRQFYLVSPNSGYFLETGYAGLGHFEPQTGSPFTTASLDGTYVYASQPAASLASLNATGTFVANGAGSATTTTDLNVGVGTINLLQAGVTSTSAYHLTDATAGRFLLGTTIVIYEINPGRFALVDTNALTTSPTIVLLY